MKNKMQIGFIGLGKMGNGMVERLTKSKKIDVVGWDISLLAIKKAMRFGIKKASSVKDLVSKLQQKKIIWLMLPAGKATEDVFQKVLSLLNKGDIVIDGANSHFQDTIRRAKGAKQKGIFMLDAGVSGGIRARKNGYALMVGGEKKAYQYCKPIFKSLGVDQGVDLVGDSGAGHYVKMVHNAIEYGMMESIAEGFDLLGRGRFKNLDLAKIAHIWHNGTIIRSFLIETIEKAFKKDSDLKSLKPYVEDTGEGKWAAIEAIKREVPFTANTYALFARFMSRDKNSMAFRMLSAMREQFGGHKVKKN